MDNELENMNWNQTEEYAKFERELKWINLLFFVDTVALFLLLCVTIMVTKDARWYWELAPAINVMILVWWLRRGIRVLNEHFDARKYSINCFFAAIRKRSDDKYRIRMAEIDVLYAPRKTRPTA